MMNDHDAHQALIDEARSRRQVLRTPTEQRAHEIANARRAAAERSHRQTMVAVTMLLVTFILTAVVWMVCGFEPLF